MSIDTKKLRQAAASARAFLKPEYGREIAAAADHIDVQAAEIAALRTNAEYGIKEREFLHAEAERLKKALRVAVLALAHATQEHGKVYEPAYNAVDAALSGESNG